LKLVRNTLFSTAFCLFFTTAAVAQGKAGDKEIRNRAEQYFARGEILFESGDFAKAAEAFLLAYETLPHPSVLLNAAMSYERAENLPQAILVYEKYLLTIQEEGSEDEEVEKRLEALNGKVCKLAISAECENEKCRILVDGIERGETPVAVTVMPGTHKIEAMEAGELASIKYVLVAPGEVLSVNLKAEPPQQKLSIKVSEPEFNTLEPLVEDGEKPKPKLGVPFWVASGVVVAAGGTALGLRLSVLKDEKDFKATDDHDEQVSIKARADKKQLAAGITLGIAGAAAAAATIFAIIDLKSSQKKESEESEGSEQVTWILGPQIGVDIRF
jgi:hypothetical protein